MPIVGLIDYGMGNLDSMRRALEECGASVRMVSNQSQIHGITHVVLPGVGSFAVASEQLKHRGIDLMLKEICQEKKIPLLGVCLGMQLLANFGDEGGLSNGLGLISGKVSRLVAQSEMEKIPHVGWNEVEPRNSLDMFRGIGTADFYFVHSYRFCEDDARNVAWKTPYCGEFTSAIFCENIWGTQFHPEKSQRVGFKLLGNFLRL